MPMTVSMALGWVLAYYWQRNKTLLRPVSFEANARWTERDQQAWKLVEARAAAGQGHLNADKLVDPEILHDHRPGIGPGTGDLLPPQSQRPRRQSDRAGDPGRGRAGVARPGRNGGQVSCRAATCSPSTTGSAPAKRWTGISRPAPSIGWCRPSFLRSTPACATPPRRWA